MIPLNGSEVSSWWSMNLKLVYNCNCYTQGVFRSLSNFCFHNFYIYNRPTASLLFTSSMLWCGECDSIEEYYNKCVGVPLQLLPTVLGLKLAVDLELGSKYAKLMKWIKHNIQMQSTGLVVWSCILQVIDGLFYCGSFETIFWNI